MPQTLFYFAANLDLIDKSKSKDPTSDIIQTHLTYRESGKKLTLQKAVL